MARARAGKGRNKLKIRSDDHVKVTAGKDRGKTGKVLRVEPTKERLYVEGLNMVKRAVRPQINQSSSTLPGTEGQLGGVIESRPLSRSKRWALVDVLERAR